MEFFTKAKYNLHFVMLIALFVISLFVYSGMNQVAQNAISLQNIPCNVTGIDAISNTTMEMKAQCTVNNITREYKTNLNRSIAAGINNRQLICSIRYNNELIDCQSRD